MALFTVDPSKKTSAPLSVRSASDLRLKEKDIEKWMAENPSLLFTSPEAVLIIGQERGGEPMADLLAVDSQGTLIVIEAKRGSSDRSTVGQLLDYAAKLSQSSYDDFNKRWQRRDAKGRDLFEAFKEFADNPRFEKEHFLKSRRFFILASAGDESMKRIITWLHGEYNVPIGFVPFQLYQQGKQHLLQIEQIDVDPVELPPAEWLGDWLFNTNERYAQGCYKKMLKDGVIALANYPITEGKLNGPRPGDRIFAYLNRKGIIAVGRMGDKPAYPSRAIFKEQKDEWNRRVEWKAAVEADKGITPAQASEWGYNLPALTVLGKMSNGKVAEKIAKELEKRRG